MTDMTMVASELAEALASFPDLDIEADLAGTRAMFAAMVPAELPEPLRTVGREERRIPGAPGSPDVRVLVYTPPGEARGPRPAILHIHGGGFVIGSPDISDFQNRTDALEQGCVVVSVAYRLAPETTWEGSLADNFAALCWMADNAQALGIDPARIALKGESAGGGHAAMLALHARDKRRKDAGVPEIAFLSLDAPMLDDRTAVSPDPHPFCGQFVWTRQKNHFGWRALLGMEPGSAGVPQAAVPARASDYTGLPPTWIGVGALDLFMEEGLAWAQNLARAGGAIEIMVVPGAFHGFTMAVKSPQAAKFRESRAAALRSALAADQT